MNNTYKTLAIIAIVMLVGLLAYFAWRAFFTPSEPPTTEVPEGEVGALPDVGEREPRPGANGSLTQGEVEFLRVSDEDTLVFDFFVSGSGEVHYLTDEGRIFIAKDGSDESVSNQSVAAINHIQESPDGNAVLAALGDPKNPNWRLFDVTDSVWRPMPQGIRYATWGDTNDELILLGGATFENSVMRATAENVGATGQYEVLVRNLNLLDVSLAFSPPNELVIKENPASFYGGRTWKLNLSSLTLNLARTALAGSITSWHRDGSVFSFNSPGDFRVLNNNLEEILPVFFKTLPIKCGSSESLVFCGAPLSLPTNLNLPEDYMSEKYFSIDELFVLEKETGDLVESFASNRGGIPALDIKNPRLVGENIYFINRFDEALYRLNLGL